MLKGVDGCVIVDTLDKCQIREEIQFKYIFIGDDWKGNERWAKTEEALKVYGAEVVYLSHTPNISTTMIREKIGVTNN